MMVQILEKLTSDTYSSSRYMLFFALLLSPFVVTIAQEKNCSYKKVLKRMSGFGKRGRGHKKDFPPFLLLPPLFLPPLFPVVVVATEAKGKRGRERKVRQKKALDRRFPFLREIFEGKESLLEGTENSMLLPSL